MFRWTSCFLILISLPTVLVSCTDEKVNNLEQGQRTVTELQHNTKESVSDAMLANPNPADWLMWRRTFDSWGYSPLSQITKKNVNDLTLAWRHNLEPGAQEGTPLIFNGVMYLSQPNDVVQAREASSGELKWHYRRLFPKELKPFVRFAPYTRNAAIYEDVLINSAGDGSVYALDLKTGELRWETEVLDYRINAARQSAGPIIANGLAVTGRSCEPQGGPDACVIVAHDAKTGKEVWRTRTIPKPGEPGDESWGDIPYAERKHVGTWMVPSFDPELNLIYIGTSVTSPAPKFTMAGADKQYLYHNSTLALNANTGEMVWYYQHLVDNWDFDHPFERLLIDVPISPDKNSVPWLNKSTANGDVRPVVTGIPGKTGIVYTLDRRTGEFLWARPTIKQNVIDHINDKGQVTQNPETIFTKVGESLFVCPASHGGKNWPAGAYSPDTGLMYFPVANTCAEYTPTQDKPTAGSLYGYAMKDQIAPGATDIGSIYAISPVTGNTQWKYDQNAGLLSLLATGGGLIFGGDSTGWFRAFDDATGEELWQVDLGAQVTGYPVTFSSDNRQYIAVPVGSAMIPSVLNALGRDIKPPESHHSIFVFELSKNNINPKASISAAVVVASNNAKKKAQLAVQMAETDAQDIAIYSRHCAVCHGANMDGGPAAPPLKGSEFEAKWNSRSSDELYDVLKGMPPGMPGTLNKNELNLVYKLLLRINNKVDK